MKSIFSLLICLLAFPLCLSAASRTWTDTQGRSFEGILLQYDDETALIERTADKRQFKLPLKSLSAGDNAYIANLINQEHLEKVMKDLPKDFNEAFEKSVDENIPMLVFYRNQETEAGFDQLVAKFVTDPKFQAKYQDKVLIVLVREKNVEVEELVGAHVHHSSSACISIMRESRSYGSRGLSNKSPEAFLKDVDYLWSRYDQSIY
ncbi:hypothetical protein [Cerasicoccus maritimus]|uniref:hypothetical protein n=1 Tax=Cerasicoccus maritimus TaxID=490089 RepID=UPI002852CEF7|nr:hypothetical protein [Cerasicoccus maritimus]